ncbi:MAG: CHASE2 domain-containing protein [Candidatus Omnitrophota bacterium]
MTIDIRKRSKVLSIILVILIFSFLAFFKVFSNHELTFYDLLFKIRPPLKTHQDLIIVEISDDTLKNLGQWPLPRDFHASLVDILSEFKAKMIIFDMFFSEPSVYDNFFSDSMKKAGNVYIPEVFDIDSKVERKYALPRAKGKISGEPLFKDSSNFAGHINTFVDSDGKIRRIPLFIEYNSRLIPQLALNTACKYLGLNIEKVSFRKREVIINDKINIPVSFENALLINFPSDWKSSFTHLSYFEILKSYKDFKEGKSPKIDLNILKDKVCIIGLTASGTSDVRAIPLESSYPLVGVQASVFNSIIQSKFIKEIPPIFSAIISLLVFFLALNISFKFRPLKAFLLILGTILTYFLLAALIFVFVRLWIDIFLVIFIITSVYTGSTIYKFLDEIKKRQILEKELQIARDIQKSFLPKDINEFGSVKIVSFMEPAKFVAGDLYDIIPLDERRLGIFIGDVSGKGVSASLIMAQTVSLFRVFARSLDSPAKILNQLNTELCKILQGRFVTALYLIVDTQSRLITASCAGHNPIILYSSVDDKILEVLPVSGPPLGVLDSLEYEPFQRTIAKNDKFLLYTDGISEARNKRGEEFGIEKVKEILFSNKASSAKHIIDTLNKEVSRFQQGLLQYDDITLILLDF